MNPCRVRYRPYLETLEDRTVPFVSIQLDSSGNLIGIFGNPPIGGLSVTQTANDFFSIMENNTNLGSYHVSGNLTLDLGNAIGPGLVYVDFNIFTFTGSLTVSVGSNSNMPVGYGIWVNANAGGSMSGDLTIRTGNGNNNVLLTGAAGTATVRGSLDDEMGFGNNTVYIQNATIAGNARVDNAFTAIFGNNSSIGGFLTMDSSQINLPSANLSYNFQNGMMIGSFVAIHTGQDNLKNIVFAGGTSIGGSAILELGNGSNQFFLQAGATIFGSLTYIGGNGNNTVNLAPGSTIFGNVSIVVGNSGSGNGMLNDVIIDGAIFGQQITFIGGTGFDLISFNAFAPGGHLNVFSRGGGMALLDLLNGALVSAVIQGGPGFSVFSVGLPPGFRLLVTHFP